jgi:biotin carboxylase
MPNVVFVAPFFLEATVRFIDATAGLPHVRLGLVSQDPADRLPPGLRHRLASHIQVSDGLDPQTIADATRRIGKELGSVDRVMGALEELQVPLGEVRDALHIPGMNAETARNFRDKSRMKEVLQQAGVPCARHTQVAKEEDVWRFAETVGYPLVVKPRAGSGSRNTIRVNNEGELRECMRWDSPAAGGMMIEEFVTGEEHSFDSVFLNGKLSWWSVNHYFPGPLEVLENPWIQWCVILPREADRPEYADIRREADKALQALGMRIGLSHMEWFRRADGTVAISEVGARPPGAQFVTLISHAHGIDLHREWARLMVFDEFPCPERKFAAGAAFLRAQGNGRVRAIHGLEQAQKEVGPVVVEVKLPKEGQRPSGTYDGDGYVIVRHPETAVVKHALDRIIRTIHVELG